MDWRLSLSLLLLLLPTLATAAAGDFEKDKDSMLRGQRLESGKDMDPRDLDYTGVCGHSSDTGAAACLRPGSHSRHRPSDAVLIPAHAYTQGAMMSMWPIEHCHTVVVCSQDAASTLAKPSCDASHSVTFQPARYEVSNGVGGSTVYRYGLPWVYWHIDKSDSSSLVFEAWPIKSPSTQWNLQKMKSNAVKVSGLKNRAAILIFTSSPYCLVRFLPLSEESLREKLLLNPAIAEYAVKDIHEQPSHYDATFNAMPDRSSSGGKPMILRRFSSLNPGHTLKPADADSDCCPNFYLPTDLNDDWGEATDSVESRAGSAYVNEYQTNKVREEDPTGTAGAGDDDGTWAFRSFRLEMDDIDQCDWIKVCLDWKDTGKVCGEEWGVLEIHPHMNMFLPFHSPAIREFAIDVRKVGYLRFTFPRQHLAYDGDRKMIEMSYGHTSTTQSLFTESMMVHKDFTKIGRNKINIVYPSKNKCKVRLVTDFDESEETRKEQPLFINKCVCSLLETGAHECTSRVCTAKGSSP